VGGIRAVNRFTIAIALAMLASSGHAAAQLADETDRSAFQAWFTLLADAQFERTTRDVIDCGALVRHAYREALRAHSPEWYRLRQLPLAVALPDVRRPPTASEHGWRLFRISAAPERFAEFADASTIVRLNTRPIGRDVDAARPGDLLYFRQDATRTPDHLMVFVGPSRFDPADRDWVVYHTGPQDEGPGEVRKVTLRDLARHPSPRWRPIPANAAFVGVFRLAILDTIPAEAGRYRTRRQ
jgi:uncharacterized protein YfaT (DUF1175 family)